MSTTYSDYWDEPRETGDARERDDESFAQLKRQLDRAYRTPFYRHHWDRHRFNPDQVASWQDFTSRCPVITKKDLVADQQAHPPFGSYIGVEAADVLRIHGSSGTSGTPTIYGVSSGDWERAGDAFAMTQWMMGVRPTDVVQFAFPFSLFFGGWGVLHGAEKVGASCFPIGMSDTRRHVELMFQVGSTVIEGTPSYLLHMAEVARGMGMDPANSPLHRAIVGGEPGGSIPATRQRIIESWGLDSACDSGSTSEMFPFCTNTECTHMQGTHLINDEVWTEVVDIDDPGTHMPDGEVGSVVYTHLWRASQPMIRFQPGDRTWMTHDPCSCGRTYPRLPQGVLGRADDTLVIRGVNVYPSAIEEALRQVEGIGLEFRIRVSRRGDMDEISVQAEPDQTVVAGPNQSEIEDRMRQQGEELLKRRCHIRIPLEIVAPNTFERTVLKARRVIDERPSLV